MRKLVTIRQIEDIKPINGADRIECAKIDGWEVVVKKGDFKKGDMCVFFEIDSFIPVSDQFEFLRKSCHRIHTVLGEGFRIKTIKLKGQISQGLVIPLECGPFVLPQELCEIGQDVTEMYGVKKWDNPELNSVDQKCLFPHFIPKTDQERIQNLKYIIDSEYEVSVKLDGSSMTVYYNGEVGVCSRNVELKMDSESKFVQVAKTLPLDKLSKYGNIAIQGELMGPGIQGNREKLSQYRFFVFDIWDIDAQKYLQSRQRIDICRELGLNHVPIVQYMNASLYTKEELLELATEIPSLKHRVSEGLVFKSVIDPSVSFKVINNNFLLKEEI